MSFDPSLIYTHGGITAPDQPDATDTGSALGPDLSQDPTQNEYYTQRLLTPPWIQAGFPDYQSYAANLRLKEEQARALTEKQINATSGASGASVTSARISTQGANERAAVQAEIDRARNAADEAHQKAIDALAQGNAAEARRQFDISSAELQRYHTLDVGIRQQEANTSAQTAGYNIYKDLTDKASNPRNFMQQFFTNRGQTAPAGSAAYGNTAIGPQGIMPFERWLPNFMQQTLGSYGSPSGAGAAPPPSSVSAPSSQGNPANPYAGTNINYGGSPTTADTAMINGVKTWAGGPYSGKPVDQSPANAGDLTPYLKNPNAAVPAFAGGGTLRMTAPHAIVNMLSGKVAAVAGEQRGRGPQGFVPETAKFSGQAIIDPITGLPSTEPKPPDGGTLLPDTSTDPGVYAPPPDIFPQPSSLPGAPIAPSTPSPATAPAPVIPALGTQPAPPGFHWVGQQLVPDAPAPLPATVAPPPPPVFGPAINPGGANPWGGPITTPSNPANPPPNPANPPQVTTPGFDFTQTPSGIGQNPTFLPEDAAANDPILKAMIDAGQFPPFLQRLYAQAKGLPGLGTNVPQTTDLPAGVPLVSKLAYTQMSPSERSAFESFLSAHGITLEDYLTLVEQASPQGGVSRSNAIPRFLSQGG